MFCSWVKAEEYSFTFKKKKLIQDAVKESIPVEEVYSQNQTIIHRETCEYQIKLSQTTLKKNPVLF